MAQPAGSTGFKIVDELQTLMAALEPVSPGECVFLNYTNANGMASLTVQWKVEESSSPIT